MTEKEHRGGIIHWQKIWHEAAGGLGFFIHGEFLDQGTPSAQLLDHTSMVLKHDEETGEIETEDARYTLVGSDRTERSTP